MEILERVLDERAGDLARALTEEAEFTPAEADRFLTEAGPAVLRSYEWQAHERGRAELGSSEQTVSDVLAGISGRSLAERVGLSQAKTWAGLRALVPALLGASARPEDRHRVRSTPRGGRPGGANREDVRRYELGFG